MMVFQHESGVNLRLTDLDKICKLRVFLRDKKTSHGFCSKTCQSDTPVLMFLIKLLLHEAYFKNMLNGVSFSAVNADFLKHLVVFLDQQGKQSSISKHTYTQKY